MSVEIFSASPSQGPRVKVTVPPEVRIAFEVARELRISPRFSDDGTPEGTIERPLAVELKRPKDAFIEIDEDEPACDLYEIQP